MLPASSLLAHGGGVPEVLGIAVPLVAVGAGVLMERAARRKARAQEQREETPET